MTGSDTDFSRKDAPEKRKNREHPASVGDKEGLKTILTVSIPLRFLGFSVNSQLLGQEGLKPTSRLPGKSNFLAHVELPEESKNAFLSVLLINPLHFFLHTSVNFKRKVGNVAETPKPVRGKYEVLIWSCRVSECTL